MNLEMLIQQETIMVKPHYKWDGFRKQYQGIIHHYFLRQYGKKLVRQKKYEIVIKKK